MSEKPIAGIVTAAIVAPLAAVCCLGPALFGSILSSVFGWFSGVDPVVTIGLALAVGGGAYGILRRRSASPVSTGPAGEKTDE